MAAESFFLGETLASLATFPKTTGGTTAAILTIVTLLYLYRKLGAGSKSKQVDTLRPPYIPSPLPFLGHAVQFGRDPINFLLKAYKKYGDIFSFTMVGKTFTYAIGSEPCSVFFNSKNEDLNAEEVYSKLVTPVFGKGVAYDVPYKVFMEQKKMLKSGLSIAHFRRYVPLIERETHEYFERWGDSGERDLFVALSELIILTASCCLHGREIREKLDEHVAQLYSDLDGGFSHLAWLLPGWLPLPSFRKRDKARLEMNSIFKEVIQKRRESPDKQYEDDILNTLVHATYKDGRPVTDDEIVGMLIGLLLAGQHTSSTTSAWLGFFLARDTSLQDQAYAEQVTVRGGKLPPLEYDQLKSLEFLDRCLKETLRLRPPIMTMMRMVKTPQTVGGFTVPVGHQLCVSPTVNSRLDIVWDQPEDFIPDRHTCGSSVTTSWYFVHGTKRDWKFPCSRFLDENAAESEKFSYIPFGAGRHRCVGESFAYTQIKTIWSVLLEKYEFSLIDGYFPPVNYSTMIHTPTRPIIKYKRR